MLGMPHRSRCEVNKWKAIAGILQHRNKATTAEQDSLLAKETLCLTCLLPLEESGRVKAIFSYTQGRSGAPRIPESAVQVPSEETIMREG